MSIRQCRGRDIPTIEQIEFLLEPQYPATIHTLTERMLMFREGFHVAEVGERVVGYVESCIWNNERFRTFEEISDFRTLHDEQGGKNMYIIFLGVHPDYRRRNIGSDLVRSVLDVARQRKLAKAQLVAGAVKGNGYLVEMYEELGFRSIRELPEWVPGMTGTFMEQKLTASR